MKYAEVAVNSPLLLPRTFSYSIPDKVSVSAGHAVWAPFGSRTIQGIVFAVGDMPQVEQTKEIGRVIDPRPVLFSHQIELARWIAEYYLCSYFEAASLMLPPGFERKVLTFFHLAPDCSKGVLPSLTDSELEVVTLLRERGRLESGELKQSLGQGASRSIEQLVRKGIAVKTEELEKGKVGPLRARQIKLAVSADHVQKVIPELERRRASQQVRLLSALVSVGGPLPLADALRLYSVSSASVHALKRRCLISVDDVRLQRDPLTDQNFPVTTPLTLSASQAKVWAEIGAEIERPGERRVFLLHGVTGSGKTEIYLRAVAQCLSLGKRAIVLVPEIALTPQTVSRFAGRFPGKVAVFHSRLSLGEQFDQWQRIRDGEFDVVVGSRGALFAPVADLGIIVVDEEHEWTYKQHEQSPRYQGRDVAVKLAELTGSMVVMGSATPDIVTYYRTQSGEYRLLQLPDRVSTGRPRGLPEVEVVDLRRELKEGNRSIFSRSLASGIREALAGHEQVILFLNRRGGATFVQCRDCGLVLRCRHCDVPLTYHITEDDLVCHYCNRRRAIPGTCPGCSSRRIRYMGVGTQKIEEEAARTFPGARVLRWDRDSARGKGSHERILNQFLAHEADILVGTQMIAKGLDFPLVTLVGVINADIGLHLPDYRANERTFQVLAQVAGRSGRGEIGGKVVIQSYSPEHYAIAAASGHDYQTFYQQEIAFRRQQGDPPFSRLACLRYSHTNASRCEKESQRVHGLLEKKRDALGLPGISLIGPSPAFTPRIRGKYRWQIIVRGPDPASLLSTMALPQGWAVDVDPVSLL